MAEFAPDERPCQEDPEDEGSVDNQILKGKTIWTTKENGLLEKLVQKHGTSSWTRIAESFNDRTGKQCRERWHNHLENGVVKGGWSHKEDYVILSLQTTIGNQWALISKMLPGRTDNAVKNRFHAIQRAKNRGKLDDRLMAIKPGVPLDADVIAVAKSVNDPQLNHELNKRLPHIFKRLYVFEDSPSAASVANTTAEAVAKQNASHPDRSSSELSSLPIHEANRSHDAKPRVRKSEKSSSAASDGAESRADIAVHTMTSLDILALVAQISGQTEQYQSSKVNANTSVQSSITWDAPQKTKNPKEVSIAPKSKSTNTSSSHEYFQSLVRPQRPFKNSVLEGGDQKMKDSHSSNSGRTSGDNMSSSKDYFDLTSSSNGGESSTTYNPSSGGTTSSNNTSERSNSGTNTDSSSNSTSGSGHDHNSSSPGPSEESSEGGNCEDGNSSSSKNGSRFHDHGQEDERQAKKKKRSNNVNESGEKINHGITGEWEREY